MKDISLQALIRSLREEVDLPGDQEKIDVAEPKGKITAADFKKLRSMNKKHSVKEVELSKDYINGYNDGYMDCINKKQRQDFELEEGANHEVAMAMSSLSIKEGVEREFEVDDIVKIKDTGEKGKVVDMSPSETFFIVNVKGKNKSFHGSNLELVRRPSISENEDHEVAMAMSSLKEIVSNASQLMQKLGNMERNIPGWIQDHITNAENYIEQANQGFHEIE